MVAVMVYVYSLEASVLPVFIHGNVAVTVSMAAVNLGCAEFNSSCSR